MTQCTGSNGKITFYNARDDRPVEPNTGERDENPVLFGQGRSLERQERDTLSMKYLTILVGSVVVGAIVYSMLY